MADRYAIYSRTDPLKRLCLFLNQRAVIYSNTRSPHFSNMLSYLIHGFIRKPTPTFREGGV